jgi:endoglucanase
VKPDAAIILETTAIADRPDVDECKRVATVGKGGVLSLMDRGTIYDRDMIDFALDTAKKGEIPVQVKRYVSGGNDAGNIHKSGLGVKTLAISVPTRYLHSPSCVAALSDYKATEELAALIYWLLSKRKKRYNLC